VHALPDNLANFIRLPVSGTEKEETDDHSSRP
jgi:hypothetical protein